MYPGDGPRKQHSRTARNYLTGFYADEKLDICASAFDGFAYGCKAALEGAGYKVGEDWPLITGQDAELMAVKNIISGYQDSNHLQGYTSPG
ncbi:MAG: hypothetical protein ACLTBV_28300 [Enterocloster bolteae]